jgi:hypothetical protein
MKNISMLTISAAMLLSTSAFIPVQATDSTSLTVWGAGTGPDFGGGMEDDSAQFQSLMNQNMEFNQFISFDEKPDNKRQACLRSNNFRQEKCLNGAAETAKWAGISIGAGTIFFGIVTTPAGGTAFGIIGGGIAAEDYNNTVNACNRDKGNRDLDCPPG